MSTPPADVDAFASTVPEHLDGVRIDVAVAEVGGLSRSRAAALVQEGRVLVDGQAVDRRAAKVASGDRLELVAGGDAVEVPPPPPAPPVRYRDDHLVVIAKPAGLVVHPGSGHAHDTLVQALQGAGIPLAPRGGEGRPGIVHRLDRDTSGLMVVACTDPAHEALAEALRTRTVERTYLTLVQGTLPSLRGRIDAPLGRHPGDRTRFAVVADGRHAVTRWEVQGSGHLGGRTVSLVQCRLETGRTHQIRVHLAGAGAPVIGDLTYGASESMSRRFGLDRLFLHAARLAFDHPVTGERIDLVEPLPDDLAQALERAELGAALPAWSAGD